MFPIHSVFYGDGRLCQSSDCIPCFFNDSRYYHHWIVYLRYESQADYALQLLEWIVRSIEPWIKDASQDTIQDKTTHQGTRKR